MRTFYSRKFSQAFATLLKQLPGFFIVSPGNKSPYFIKSIGIKNHRSRILVLHQQTFLLVDIRRRFTELITATVKPNQLGKSSRIGINTICSFSYIECFLKIDLCGIQITGPCFQLSQITGEAALNDDASP